MQSLVQRRVGRSRARNHDEPGAVEGDELLRDLPGAIASREESAFAAGIAANGRHECVREGALAVRLRALEEQEALFAREASERVAAEAQVSRELRSPPVACSSKRSSSAERAAGSCSTGLELLIRSLGAAGPHSAATQVEGTVRRSEEPGV